MAVVVLTSATGSPGVTTTGVGLSLLWESEVLLADCDRTASQAVLAGYLQGLVAPGLGLSGLAAVHRQGGPVSAALLAQTVSLAQGEPRRHLLPGFSHAAAPLVFDTVWGDVGDALATASRGGIDVIVDAGRIGAGGLPVGLLAHSDAVLVLTRSNLVSLATLRLHLPGLREAMTGRTGAGLGLVVIGPGRPYSAREIEHQFALPVWAEIDHQPDLAAVFSDGAAEPRRFLESGYVRSLRTAVSAIASRLSAQERRIGRRAAPAHPSDTAAAPGHQGMAGHAVAGGPTDPGGRRFPTQAGHPVLPTASTHLTQPTSTVPLPRAAERPTSPSQGEPFRPSPGTMPTAGPNVRHALDAEVPLADAWPRPDPPP